MRSALILLTNAYPCGGGELFLESELPLLAAKFTDILILVQEAAPGVGAQTPLPENVRCINIARVRKRRGRAQDLRRAALHCLGVTSVYRQDRAAVGHSPLKRMFLEYFEARARRQFQETLAALAGEDFSSYDRVVIYSYWFFVGARVAMLLKEHLRHPNLKLISRAHGYDLYLYANSLNYLPLRETLLRATDKLYACSTDGRDYLRARYPAFSEKIVCFRLGTPDRGFRRDVSRQPFHLVSCSHVLPIKRVERIVAALSLLRREGITPRWTHIGAGVELDAVRAAARELLAPEQVEFCGNLPNEDVLEFYRTHPIALFVNVSEREGLPVSIMEAASCGIPAVATDVGGTQEVVVDGVTGTLLHKDFTDHQLAEAIRRYIDIDDAAYSACRAAARHMWETRYDAAANYAAFAEDLLQVGTIT